MFDEVHGFTGGYSGDPIDSRDECLQVDGFSEVLCMAWKPDNAGPHSVDEVRSALDGSHLLFSSDRLHVLMYRMAPEGPVTNACRLIAGFNSMQVSLLTASLYIVDMRP